MTGAIAMYQHKKKLPPYLQKGYKFEAKKRAQESKNDRKLNSKVSIDKNQDFIDYMGKLTKNAFLGLIKNKSLLFILFLIGLALGIFADVSFWQF